MAVDTVDTAGPRQESIETASRYNAPAVLKPGATLADGQYSIVKMIGKGGCGCVYRAHDYIEGKPKAIKMVDLRTIAASDSLKKRLENEIKITQECGGNPGVIQMDRVFIQGHHYLCVVMEHVDGEDLLQTINRHSGSLGEDFSRMLFRQLLSAVQYLHDRNLCHRDIKPENLMVAYGTNHLKMIDFGLSKHVSSARTLGIGTPGYLAPELIIKSSNGPREGDYDPIKADCWGIGATLYLMIAGYYPFAEGKTQDIALTLRNQVAGKFRALPEHLQSTPVEDLITRLLQPNPARRCSIREAMEHPWTQGCSTYY